MADCESCRPTYPRPHVGQVTARDVMNHHYFMSQEEWETCRLQAKRNGDYDIVIIGTSFCALAVAKQALSKNRDLKILFIDRGDFLLPDHFQNLPSTFARTIENPGETFHWSVSKETADGNGHIKWQHGVYNFVGGRSSFWSGWCPQPTEAEMNGWPTQTVQAIKKHFPAATEMLNVISADEIFKSSKSTVQEPIFGHLQKVIQESLQEGIKHCGDTNSADVKAVAAPLAVENKKNRYDYYKKYSVVGDLLQQLDKKTSLSLNMQASEDKKCPQVQAMINCVVTKIQHDCKGNATALETSEGKFELGKAKLILAMGTLPSTTLILNSFPDMTQVGKRFTAHFMSCITARIPLCSLKDHKNISGIEMGAVYVSGVEKDSKHQFHIQVTAIRDNNPEGNEEHRIRHLPDYFASPSLEQLTKSKEHVVIVCACLGQLDHDNKENWFQIINAGEGDVTCNATLQVIPNDKDKTLWDTMEKTTFKLLQQLSPSGELKYWHSAAAGQDGSWNTDPPTPEMIRHEGLVHEASTMWIGENEDSPVGLDYRLRGTDNVYITGASLWPTAGSWNPVGTIVSMATHLADTMLRESTESSADNTHHLNN